MQSDYKEITKLTSLKTGIDEQVYKDLCNFLFLKTSNEMKKPKNLIIRLRGIGSWFLRMKRLKIKLGLYEKNNEPDWSESIGIDGKEIPEIIRIFKDRLSDYGRYIEKRNEIKKIRNESRLHLQTINREDACKKET